MARLVLLLFLACAAASAQVVVSAKTAAISYVEGPVTLGGESVLPIGRDWPSAQDGALLRTSRRGRAEMLLNACVALHLDVNSELRVVSNRADETRVELIRGAAMVEADAILRGTRVTIVVGNATVPVTRPDLFRFDADPARLRVLGGKATVQRKAGATVTVGKGRDALLDDSGAVGKFEPDRRSDALGRWSETRIRTLAIASGQRGKDAREDAQRDVAATVNARNASNPGAVPRVLADENPIEPLPTADAVFVHPSDAPRLCAGPRW